VKILILLSVLFSGLCSAVVETYQFDDDSTRQRYHQFVDELRCPKCQNQNLAGSNSPIAKDLRRELHRLLSEGRSDSQVVEYMVNRYGDFILYRPRFNLETAILWFAPSIFLLSGVIIAWRVFRGQHLAAIVDDAGDNLNDDEQAKLQTLLNKDAEDAEGRHHA
jgi:cytochrome c-type biogenesis protein CcmH